MNWFQATWQEARTTLALRKQLAADQARLKAALTVVPRVEHDVTAAIARWRFKNAPHLMKLRHHRDTK